LSLEESNITVGGLQFKGVYIALLLTIVSTIGGTIWTASTLYSRLEGVEAQSIPDIEPLSERLALVEQELKNNDVAGLQGNLAALATNLETIIEQQQKLLLIQDKVTELDLAVTGMQATVKTAELITEKSAEAVSKIEVLQREVNDLWSGLDFLSNPYGN
tara:strand:- start:27089 stop:27568 length:480 start_codon:yes stop_codon:yes gene_type:complete